MKTSTRLLTCPECGDEFKKKFSGQICCNKQCAFKYIAKKNTKGITVLCTYDGKPVYKMQSRVRKYNFCGVPCKIAYLKSPQNTSMSKGWHQKEEAIEKIRKGGLGRKPTAENLEKLRMVNRNRVWTVEMREKARQSHLGKITPEEVIQKIKANAKYGWKNKSWKGRYAQYAAKHTWAAKKLKEPKVCIYSAQDGNLCSGRIEASNNNHKYYKKINDWAWRCTYHHKEYDIQHGLLHPKGKIKHFFAKIDKTQKRIFLIDGLIVENRFSK